MMCLYSTSSSYCISYTETLYIIIFLTVAITSRYRSDFVCSLLLRQTDNARTCTKQYTMFIEYTQTRAQLHTLSSAVLARSARYEQHLFTLYVLVHTAVSISIALLSSSVAFWMANLLLWLFLNTLRSKCKHTDHSFHKSKQFEWIFLNYF